jgi:hypothetical protein
MNRFLTFIILTLLPITLLAQNDFDSLLKELDKTVDNYEVYSIQKEDEINKLKELLRNASTDRQKQVIGQKLFDEYKLYQSDSALVYARNNLQLANTLKDLSKINSSKLNLASIMGTLGMYKEATDVLYKMNIQFSPDLKGVFYHVNTTIYDSMSDYTTSPEGKKKYELLTQQYRDSTIQTYPSNSNLKFIDQASKLIGNQKYDETLNLLLDYFPTIPKNNPDQAIVAYLISQSYHGKKEVEQEKKWLTISAISDLQLAKKEYISLRSIAFLLYEEGDIDRSYKYMKRALEDALFCNARLRTYEISKMMPIINEAYEKQNETNRSQLILFLLSASVLSLFLMAALFMLFKQMRKLSTAKQEISIANIQLSQLNSELYVFNQKLNETNNSLSETNLLKEIYIGRYMDQCSDYIGKLEGYRRKLNLMATTGKMNDLVSAVKSKEFIENELAAFYTNFDQTFLQLFPHFIREFSTLLIDDEITQLKEGELLNTELRIFALIRLGIKDSAKIAVFLRYSVSTIYNYRSQVKNKAVGPRDDFELAIMRIGKDIQ